MNVTKNKIQQELINCRNVGHYFGIQYGISQFINKFMFRDGDAFLKYKKSHYERICEYLKEKYLFNLNIDYSIISDKIERDSPIWLMWWQGRDCLPEMLNETIKSIERHRGQHPIVVISEKNLNDYIELPDYIMRKFQSGQISITHMSDIIRFTLLYKYGGFWIDSTIYMTSDFDEDIYNYQLYSLKHGKGKYLCYGYWSAYFWAGCKENPFFLFMRDFFFEYWKYEEYLIDYFLVDCLIKIAYDEIECFKKMIEIYPTNNIGVYEMENQMDISYIRSKKYDKDTYIYKLNRRNKHQESVDGEITLYGKLLKGGLIWES